MELQVLRPYLEYIMPSGRFFKRSFYTLQPLNLLEVSLGDRVELLRFDGCLRRDRSQTIGMISGWGLRDSPRLLKI
jgi:hypothetical protein